MLRAPHSIRRFLWRSHIFLDSKSLAIYWTVPPKVLRHFRCPVPLLEKLDINICQSSRGLNGTRFNGALFNGELPSLRELSLSSVITDLAWRNMESFTAFTLSNREALNNYKVSMTRILGFFESHPFLQQVHLKNPTPDSTDAPPGRLCPCVT